MTKEQIEEAIKFWVNQINWYETLPREKQFELIAAYLKMKERENEN